MADNIYGGSDKNYFQFPGNTTDNFYLVVNTSTKVANINQQGPPNSNDRFLGTYNFTTNKFTPRPSFTGQFNPTDAKVVSTIKDHAISTTSRGIIDNSTQKGKAISKVDANNQATQLLTPNTARSGSGDNPTTNPTSNPNSDPNSTSNTPDISSYVDQISKAVESGAIENTRTKFLDVIYPLSLDIKTQDCIKFSILEYKPRTLSLRKDFQNMRVLSSENGKIKNSIGSITLPIPGSISDRNSVDWSPDNMSNMQAGFGSIAMKFLGGGVKSAETEAKNQIVDVVGGDQKLLEAIIQVKATESAVGSNNIMSRQYGAILNPNLELLFNSPSLRDFTFQFRMTPREPDEAIAVKKIIRYFKQAMAVQRSKSVILLKSPFVFGIQYLTKNEDHPYLNKFKECALTQCSVNYTPENTYSVYEGEPSMTAYEMTLTFQELEPIFNDDYGTLDANIGY